MLRLLLTRHGQSQWQILGDEAGSDSALSDKGWRQADRLGGWLASNIHVDFIYASPLQRARETAQLVAAHLDLPVHLVQDLQEAWFFTSEELPTSSTPLAAQGSQGHDHTQGTQVYRAFRSQVAQALRDILDQHQDGTILIVAHVGTIATAIRLLLGSDGFTVSVNNTTLHSLAWNGKRWQLEYIDRGDHLVDL